MHTWINAKSMRVNRKLLAACRMRRAMCALIGYIYFENHLFHLIQLIKSFGHCFTKNFTCYPTGCLSSPKHATLGTAASSFCDTSSFASGTSFFR